MSSKTNVSDGCSKRRQSAAPSDFPTVAETVPGFAVTGWFGAPVSGGTTEPVREAIRTACNELLQQKAVIERLAAVTTEPIGGTEEDFLTFLSSERARWGELIKSSGMSL